MIPSMSGKGYASKTFSRTSRTCLQLPRQLKPGQEHSRCPARPNVTLYEADGSRELVNSQLPVSSRGVSVGVALGAALDNWSRREAASPVACAARASSMRAGARRRSPSWMSASKDVSGTSSASTAAINAIFRCGQLTKFIMPVGKITCICFQVSKPTFSKRFLSGQHARSRSDWINDQSLVTGGAVIKCITGPLTPWLCNAEAA